MSLLAGALGMGVILSYNERMSSQVKVASKSLKSLQKDAEGVTNTIERQAERAGQMVDRYRTKMVSSLKIIGAGMALTAPYVMMGKTAAGTEKTLSDIKSLIVGTGSAAEEASEQIRMIGEEASRIMQRGTVVPKSEILGTAMYNLVSALGVDQAMGALETTVDLGVAGIGSTTEAAQIMTTLMATFGARMDSSLTPLEKAKIIAEELASSIAGLETTLPALASAMKYSAGQASAMGISIKEAAIVTATAQTGGLKETLAGTGYLAFLREAVKIKEKFKKATESSSNSLDAFIERTEKGSSASSVLGASLASQLNLTDASGKLLPFYTILGQIEKAFISSRNEAGIFSLTARQAAELQAVFGDEGQRLIVSTLGQAAAIKEKIEAEKEYEALKAMVDARQKGAIVQYETATNKLKDISGRLGQNLLPMMTRMVELFDKVLVKINAFIIKHPAATEWLFWGGAVTGVLTTISGLIMAIRYGLMMIAAQKALLAILTQGMSTQTVLWRLGNTMFMLRARMILMAVATKIWAAAQWLLNIALSANPIGLIIIGIAALIAIIVLLVKYWDKVKAAINKVWNWLKAFTAKTPTWLLLLINPLLLIIKYWDLIKLVALIVWDKIKDKIDKFSTWLSEIWESIKNIASNVWDWIYSKVLSIISSIMNNPIVKAFTSLFNSAIDFGKEIFGGGGSEAASSTAPPVPDMQFPILAGAPNVNYGDLAVPANKNLGGATTNNKNTFDIKIYPRKDQNAKEIAQEVIRISKEKELRGKNGKF